MHTDEQKLLTAVQNADLETVIALADSQNINKTALKDNLRNPILCLALALVDANKPTTIKIVEKLIIKDYPVNLANDDGDTPLHIAVRKGHVGLIGLLIKKGADLHAVNELDETPIHLAAAANIDLEAIYKKQEADRQKAIQMQQGLQAPALVKHVRQQDASKRRWPRPPTFWTPEQIRIVQDQLEALIDDIEEGIPIELRGVSILSLQAIIRDECHDKFKELMKDKEVFTAIERHLKSQNKDVYKTLSSLGQQLDVLTKIYRHPFPHNRSDSNPDYEACSKKDPVSYPAVPIGYVAVKKDNNFLQRTPPMDEQKNYLYDYHNGYFFEPKGILSLNNVSDFVLEKHRLSTAHEVKQYIEDSVEWFTHAWQTAKAALEEAEIKNDPRYQENYAEKEAIESLYHKVLLNIRYEIEKIVDVPEKSNKSTTAPRIFISYAWDDHNPEKNITQLFIVNKLAKDLRRLGFEPFYDKQEFKPGDNLKEKMQQQVNKCDYIIMLCTPLYKDRVSKPSGVQVEVEAICERLRKNVTAAEAIGKFRKGNVDTNRHIFTESKVIPVILRGNFGDAVPIFPTQSGEKRPIQITNTLITDISSDEKYQEGMLEIAHTLLKFFLIENGYQGDLLGNIYAKGERPESYRNVFVDGKKAILTKQYKDSVGNYEKRLDERNHLKDEGKYVSRNLDNYDYKRFRNEDDTPRKIIENVLAGAYSKDKNSGLNSLKEHAKQATLMSATTSSQVQESPELPTSNDSTINSSELSFESEEVVSASTLSSNQPETLSKKIEMSQPSFSLPAKTSQTISRKLQTNRTSTNYPPNNYQRQPHSHGHARERRDVVVTNQPKTPPASNENMQYVSQTLISPTTNAASPTVTTLSSKASFFQPAPLVQTTPWDVVMKKSQEMHEQKRVTEADVAEVLDEVGKGHLDRVKAMLAKNPSLVYATGKLTDVTGKTYTDITLLQYAFIAMDLDMCDLVLGTLKIVGNEGMIRYQLDAEVIKRLGGVFSLKPSLKAYYEHIKKYGYNSTYKQRQGHWDTVICRCQKTWPAWLTYCIGKDLLWMNEVCARPQNRIDRFDVKSTWSDVSSEITHYVYAAAEEANFDLDPYSTGPDAEESETLKFRQRYVTNFESLEDTIQRYRATLEAKYQLSKNPFEAESEPLAQQPTPQPSM